MIGDGIAPAEMEDATTGNGISARLRRFVNERHGVAAVEFALILPVMVLMYVGTVELTNAISVNRKVVATASTVGDLTAQASNIDDTSMSGILDASAAVMEPYSSSPLKLRVTQVVVDATGKATVGWSSARNMTAFTKGSSFSGLPTGLKTPSTYLIYSEVNYGYVSPIGQFIQGTLTLSESFYLRPRVGSCVQRNGVCS